MQNEFRIYKLLERHQSDKVVVIYSLVLVI